MNGYGRHIETLPIESGVTAVYTVMIGQTFAVLGMALAKVSLSLFLLRIVVVTWHKFVLWFAIVSIMAISITVDFVFWLQCSPTKSIYDPRVDGECNVGVKDVSLLLGSMGYNSLLDDLWACSFFANLKTQKKAGAFLRTFSLRYSHGFSSGICRWNAKRRWPLQEA